MSECVCAFPTFPVTPRHRCCSVLHPRRTTNRKEPAADHVPVLLLGQLFANGFTLIHSIIFGHGHRQIGSAQAPVSLLKSCSLNFSLGRNDIKAPPNDAIATKKVLIFFANQKGACVRACVNCISNCYSTEFYAAVCLISKRAAAAAAAATKAFAVSAIGY